jgi:hypothetical protein
MLGVCHTYMLFGWHKRQVVHDGSAATEQRLDTAQQSTPIHHLGRQVFAVLDTTAHPQFQW